MTAGPSSAQRAVLRPPLTPSELVRESLPGPGPSRQFTVTSPAGSTGTVDITVTGPTGTSAIGAPDEYTYT